MRKRSPVADILDEVVEAEILDGYDGGSKTVLLITYDLHIGTKQRPPIVKAIKKLGSSCVKLSESSCNRSVMG